MIKQKHGINLIAGDSKILCLITADNKTLCLLVEDEEIKCLLVERQQANHPPCHMFIAKLMGEACTR